MTDIVLKQIGFVTNSITTPQDDQWGEVVSTIEIDGKLFDSQSLLGLEEFSHLEVIYFMHQVAESAVPTGARHPRNLNHLPKVGIFAQRPKARPNRLGLSRCQLLHKDGLILTVKGLDAINGSPVLDIKPYFPEFAPRGDVYHPEWTLEVLKNYY